MVNKKGWLRIVEASIAILIIFSVLIVVNTRTQLAQENVDLTSLTTPILEEMARNVSFRDQIVENGKSFEGEVRNFVGARLTQTSVKYDVAICDISEICSLPAYPSDAEEIYAGERVISASLNYYSPKKVKIFLWRSVVEN